MQNIKHTHNKSGKALIGAFLLIFGGLLLLDNLTGIDFDWIFSWPMILIAIGLYIGSKNNFRNPASYILIGIGAFFLLSEYTRGLHEYFFPLLLIGGGLWLLLRKKKTADTTATPDWNKRVVSTDPDDPDAQPAGPENTASFEDKIESVSIFGGVKKNVVSKNFRGGEIVCIMGGAEINMIQADIQQPVVIEVVQVFGGTKLILPPHWIIQSEMAAVFGGIEDKRPIHPNTGEQTKILIVKGTSIFGGLSIVSY